MTQGSSQVNVAELESAINFFYDQFANKEVTHFELLGIPKNATSKQIEAAYRKYSDEFSPQRISLIPSRETRKKGDFLIERGQKAHEILIDYEKRAAYEKRGFKDEAPPVEEDLEEQAKVIYKKAKSLKAMKDFGRAAKAMEEAIKLDDTKPGYYLLLGLCQTQVPSLKREAEKNLQKAAEMEDWNAEPFAALGMLFYSERLYKRAESYFRKALELEPSHELAASKLKLIAGPEVKPMDKVGNTLKKIMPTFFGKKK